MSRLLTLTLVAGSLLVVSAQAWPEWGAPTECATAALKRGSDDGGDLVALKRGSDDGGDLIV